MRSSSVKRITGADLPELKSSNSEEWTKLLTVNYVFAFRCSKRMQQELLAVGTNPFDNYRFKFGGRSGRV